MMNGVVNAALQATLLLTAQDSSGQGHQVEAVIDSGYDGAITLPPSQIAGLGLTRLTSVQGQLADGTTQIIDVYRATVIWDGQPRDVEVDAIDGPTLLGTAMLQGHDLQVRFVVGGAVTITAIP